MRLSGLINAMRRCVSSGAVAALLLFLVGGARAEAAPCPSVAAAGTDRSVKAIDVEAEPPFSCRTARELIRAYSWTFTGVSGGARIALGDTELQCARSGRRVTCLSHDRKAVRWTHRLGRRARACGEVTASYPDAEGGSGVRLLAIGLDCRHARRLARQCIRNRRVPGWRGGFYSDDESLGRADPSFDSFLAGGARRIDMKGIAGGAPNCISSPS